MMRKTAAVTLLLAAVLALTACQTPSANTSGEKNGATKKTSQSTTSTVPLKQINSLSNFKVTKSDGTQTDMNSILKNADITVFNVWEPSCQSCTDELKAFAELSKRYEGKAVQIVGIIKGVTTPQDKNAQAVLDETKVKYTQLLDSKELDDQLPDLLKEAPSTLFVSKDSEIISSVYTGPRDKAFLENEIDKYAGLACNDDGSEGTAVG